MEENEVISENMQEVADLAPQATEQEVETVVESAKEQEVAEPVEAPVKPVRDFEKDKAYADMRRDIERHTNENQKLMDALKKFGFEGNNVDDVVDNAMAHYYEKPVEEIRNERIAREKQESIIASEKAELEGYRAEKLQSLMDSDLAKIQKLDPNIKSFDDLPDEYFDLIKKGIDGERAFKLLNVDDLYSQKISKAEQNAIEKIQANSKSAVGSLDGVSTPPKSYADMTDAEFEKVYQRALKGELKKS